MEAPGSSSQGAFKIIAEDVLSSQGAKMTGITFLPVSVV